MTLEQLLLKPFTTLLERWDEEYRRGIRLHALRLRERWRKADVPLLLHIGVPHAAQRRIGRLLQSKSPGRGVIRPPKSLVEAIVENVNLLKALGDHATPANVRRQLYKQTRWWPYFVEAAYRGELEKARRARGDKSSPHLRPSEIAERNVAEAAAISPAEVRRLSHQVRKERGGAPPPDEPATSAAELKQHLEKGIGDQLGVGNAGD